MANIIEDKKEDLINQLFLGDCLEIMETFPANCVDMVLCDLPYGTTKLRWDTPIDLEKMWKLLNKVCKERAAMVFTAAQPFTSSLGMSNIKNLKYEWVWEKPQGTNPLNAKVMPLKNHENILVFYRKAPSYKPQMTKGTPIKAYEAKGGQTLGETQGSLKSMHKENKGTRYPKTVQKWAQERTGLHPTQKPVPMFKYLIETYTNEEDIVLDMTIGSGTTAIAALECNRNFIGIELDENYFDVADERIEKWNK
jgi:site-specific DNA-methyltransferase (adenine-specific)